MALGLASSLRSLGHEVLGPYPNGRAAYDAIEGDQPGLLMLDIRMPEMCGLEVASLAWERWNVPSVMLTAYAGEEYLAEARGTGVFGYLLKPVSSDHLRVAISIATARAEAQMMQRDRISQLERSLTERRTIERAKWRLVSDRGMTEPEAHDLLQKYARTSRRRLLDIAQLVLDAEAIDELMASLAQPKVGS